MHPGRGDAIVRIDDLLLVILGEPGSPPQRDAAGRLRLNTAPDPSRLPAVRSPPWARARSRAMARPRPVPSLLDRKSTRLNSSHANISYAVFCLKKKKDNHL